MFEGTISCDVDTLESIYKGCELRRPGGYTYAELRMGLENFAKFLRVYDIKATLFMVGNDFLKPQNIPYIKSVIAEGHEIANHTLTHAQGFRLLSTRNKEAEIAGMETICQQKIGRRPVGFRSPGWNISDDALPILRRRGYLYDSSVFPSSLNPLLKFLHWCSTERQPRGERSTLGQFQYMLAPARPYMTTDKSLSKRGTQGLLEFPVTVVPILRLPFSATFLLATGLEMFKFFYRMLKSFEWPIHYQFHLSDFVDYSHPDLVDQVPRGNGVYVPKALRTSLQKKWDLFERALEIMVEDYQFITLEQWARTLLNIEA